MEIMFIVLLTLISLKSALRKQLNNSSKDGKLVELVLKPNVSDSTLYLFSITPSCHTATIWNETKL